MFFGEFEHAVDVKGRVILPSKFREPFEAGAYLTKVIDGCLAVYTNEEFQVVAKEMQEKSKRGLVQRNVVRSFAAGTAEVVPDRQGRIAIPANLRTFAELDDKVMITGQINRLEIWDAAKWARVNSEGEAAMNAPQPDLDDMTI